MLLYLEWPFLSPRWRSLTSERNVSTWLSWCAGWFSLKATTKWTIAITMETSVSNWLGRYWWWIQCTNAHELPPEAAWVKDNEMPIDSRVHTYLVSVHLDTRISSSPPCSPLIHTTSNLIKNDWQLFLMLLASTKTAAMPHFGVWVWDKYVLSAVMLLTVPRLRGAVLSVPSLPSYLSS